MNSSKVHGSHRKKHAGHPSTAPTQSPTALFIAFIRSSAIGSGCALGIALLFLLFGTYVISRTADPIELISPIAQTVLYLAALFCGIFTVRIHGSSPWLCGIISSVLLLLFCLLLGAFLPSDGAMRTIGALLAKLPVIPLALFGAHLSKKRPTKSRRRRK